MKVVTKSVIIENEEFVFVKNFDEKYHSENHIYYGTISVNDLNENGVLKRQLNGFDMCIEDTIGGALQRRKNHILCERFLKEHPEIDLLNSKNVDKYVDFMNTLNFKY